MTICRISKKISLITHKYLYMKKITEVEVIYNAFSDTLMRKLPSREKDYPDWYRERLEKCNECKYNTKNIPNKYLPISLYVSKMLGKHRCSICTCFLKQKCWSKTEMCAMGETESRPKYLPEGYISQGYSEEPRWNRLELITMRADEFNLTDLDSKKYNADLTSDGSGFVFNLLPINEGENVDFEFTLETRHSMFIRTVNASCKCTVPDLSYIDNNHIRVKVHINTEGLGSGSFVKYFKFGYSMKDDNGVPLEDQEFIEFRINGFVKGVSKPEPEKKKVSINDESGTVPEAGTAQEVKEPGGQA